MTTAYANSGASTAPADIKPQGGGFIAIASDGEVDRDGEVIAPGCFNPLPESIPVHLDHTMRAADVVGRGRPYYVGRKLMIDATFSGSATAQDVRAKVKDGTLDSLSIVFTGRKWETVDGVRTCVQGELLAADIVSIPSNRGARILSMRGLSSASVELSRQTAAEGLLTLARAEIAECKRLGYANQSRGLRRMQVDEMLREVLTPNESASSITRNFLRSL